MNSVSDSLTLSAFLALQQVLSAVHRGIYITSCLTCIRMGVSEVCQVRYTLYMFQGEGRDGVETAIHRASPSVMRASLGVRRSNCKQIWLRVHDPSEGMLKLLLYKILLV